jgi:hypothetical protein
MDFHNRWNGLRGNRGRRNYDSCFADNPVFVAGRFLLFARLAPAL